MAFKAGERVGDYDVIGPLGSGGLGEVYEVRHAISRRAEAMKILLPDQRAGAEMDERFHREIQMLGALNHRNIAALHNAFRHDGQLVMIMELVPGETLRSRAVRSAMPVPRVLQYAEQILSALEYAHSQGVVHRDIKPSNIMITASDETKLLDFGIALSERSPGLTSPGFIVGSVSYMSPEQLAGDKATARSDIYSVGVMLYEILTGRLPISGTSSFEIMRAHLHNQPVDPIELNPLLPVALSKAILKSLEKNPMDRFASAQEFLAALSEVPKTGMEVVFSVATTQFFAPGNATPVSGSHAPVAAGQGSGSRPPASGSHSFPLDDITRKLAVYIGPIASIVVRKLAADCAGLDQLYEKAATQIPKEADRRRFLESRRG